MTIQEWFDENPGAVAYVTRWVKAKRDGNDLRGTRAILGELQAEFDFPFNSQPKLLRWIKRTYGERYAAGVAVTNVLTRKAVEDRRAGGKPEREATDEELLELDRAKARVSSTQREAKKIIKALERELRDSKRRQHILDELEQAPDPGPFHIKRRGGKQLPAATYCMMASDWHMEERVRPETIGWRNEYNPEIAQERARQFFKSNLKMLNAARSAWDIQQGLFWLGGDLISGYIHDELEEENFLSPTEASLLVYRTLVSGIHTLLDESDLEHILVPTSHGNHGRLYKKPRVASSAKNSHEWLVYQFLKEKFADEPRVTFQISSGYHNRVELYGGEDRPPFRLRFHHGDEVKYNGGIGGITVPLYRRLGRQAEGGDYADLDVIGHHHRLGFPPRVATNGSLIGWNAYAESKGFGYEDAMQGSFVIDERYQLVNNANPIIVQRRSR